MRLGASLFAIALLLACSSGSNHATTDAGSDVESDSGPDTGGSSNGGSGSSGSSGSGGSGTGSSSGSFVPDGSGQPACTITLKGAVSLSFPCTTKTEYFTAADRSAFTIAVADPRPLQLISITLQHQGHPMSGTWASADPTVSGGAMVQEVPADAGVAPTWQCTAGMPGDGGSPDAGDAGANEGSFTLDLMVGQGMPTPTGESFGSTGTFTATLPALTQSGATGNVTIHANF